MCYEYRVAAAIQYLSYGQHRCGNATIISDFLAIHWYVQIDPDEDPFSLHIKLFD
ncbi:MAG: hypothetical protein WBX25_13975 [Rhodomicrobium sp.]